MPDYLIRHSRAMRWIVVTSLLPILVLVLCFSLDSCQQASRYAFSQTSMHSSSLMTDSSPDHRIRSQQSSLQLQTFQSWIMLMQQYGGDASRYQLRYKTDQHVLQQATTDTAYQVALMQTAADINTIKIPVLKTEIDYLQQHLHQQVHMWEQQHPYHDTYNQTTYHMGFEYDDHTGISTQIQDALAEASTVADYQQLIEELTMYLTNFHAMTLNATDKTPYNQVHATDIQLMKTYGRLNQKVLVVSLWEQVMRVYDHGKLVRAFLVTTGQPEKPSLPGNWSVESHEKNMIFKANVPENSPYWFPDTPIDFAIQYHSNGYYIHDSWWRIEYGPYTQFPHQDVAGDSAADLGSHGCINLSKADASWVYNYVGLFAGIIIY